MSLPVHRRRVPLCRGQVHSQRPVSGDVDADLEQELTRKMKTLRQVLLASAPMRGQMPGVGVCEGGYLVYGGIRTDSRVGRDEPT